MRRHGMKSNEDAFRLGPGQGGFFILRTDRQTPGFKALSYRDGTL
jgi:hypothetical protein